MSEVVQEFYHTRIIIRVWSDKVNAGRQDLLSFVAGISTLLSGSRNRANAVYKKISERARVVLRSLLMSEFRYFALANYPALRAPRPGFRAPNALRTIKAERVKREALARRSMAPLSGFRGQ
jgi:hypothetical protein